MTNVLIVSNDPSTAHTIKFILDGNTFIQSCSIDVGHLVMTQPVKFDFIIIAHKTVAEGKTFLTNLRQRGVTTPVLMVNVSQESKDIVCVLNAGADDYLPSPFHPSELLARINAVLRRSRQRRPATIRIGKIVIDQDEKILLVDNRMVQLTAKEFQSVELLARRAGSIVSIERINTYLYEGSEFVHTRICVASFMRNAIRKLAAAGASDYLTRIGSGYKLEQPPN